MFAGPIYDKNNDGLEDEVKGNPTHVFVVLLRCSFSTQWQPDYAHCKDPYATRVLSFALPLVERDYNCLVSSV